MNTLRLSRQTLEAIVQGAVSGERLTDPRKQKIADSLRIVIAARLQILNNRKYPGPGRIGRKDERAWTRLSTLSRAERDNLIQRAMEYAALLELKGDTTLF